MHNMLHSINTLPAVHNMCNANDVVLVQEVQKAIAGYVPTQTWYGTHPFGTVDEAKAWRFTAATVSVEWQGCRRS